MTTNITNLTNTTDLSQVLAIVNSGDVTKGWFVLGTIISIYFVAWGYGKKQSNNQTAFIYAGASALFFSFFFYAMGLLSFMIFASTLVVAGLSVVLPFFFQD